MQPLLGLGTGTDVRCMTHNEGWKWVALGSGFKGVATLSLAHSHPTNYDSSRTAVEKRKAGEAGGGKRYKCSPRLDEVSKEGNIYKNQKP